MVDSAKFLSQVNHRLYRFSRVYEAKVTIDSNVADATTVDVYALADTWYLTGALKLAKSAWDASNAEEIAMNNGRVARWNDFRIDTAVTGAGTGLATFHQRQTLAAIPFTAGEFELSKVVDQAGVTRTFTTAAPAATEYNIFDEYNDQPGTSADPEIVSTGPYSGLLPNLEPGAAAAISDDGNLPPYDQNGWNAGIWVKVGTIHLATGRQTVSTGFFKAPMGMIALVGVGFLPDNATDMSVEYKAGQYKGVMSESMLE